MQFSNTRVGQQVGHYQLTQLLGRGGFSEVYLGEHIYLKSQAAVKILDMHLSTSDVGAFLDEARTLALLRHPHIVRVLDAGVEQGTPYLVMEYAQRGTLRHHYPQGTRLDLATLALYTRQMATALQYAHEHRVIHRDIKPENMLLQDEHHLLLSDFGIALLTQSSQYQTPGQKIVGTAGYMAPEQCQGRAHPASDQYALGIVVYEWLTGERPFRGSFLEVCSQHALRLPPSLCSQLPTLSPRVEEVVMKALAKNPEERFPRVENFATALTRACQTEPPAPSPLPPARPFSNVPNQSALIATLQVPEIRALPAYPGPKNIPAGVGVPTSAYGHPGGPQARPLPLSPKARRRIPLLLSALLILLVVLLVSGTTVILYEAGVFPGLLGGLPGITAPGRAGTPAPTVTPTPTLTPTPVPQSNPFPAYVPGTGSLAFKDPLTSSVNFPIRSDSVGLCQFHSDGYHVSAVQKGSQEPCLDTVSFRQFSDVLMEVQMRIVLGSCGGLLVRTNFNMQNYYFQVCTNRSFALYKITSSGYIILYSSPPIDIIRGGSNETNLLALEARGTSLSLFANGTQLITVPDSSYSYGLVGFNADSSDNGPTDLIFSQVSVWRVQS